jgi:hypothetical protein
VFFAFTYRVDGYTPVVDKGGPGGGHGGGVGGALKHGRAVSRQSSGAAAWDDDPGAWEAIETGNGGSFSNGGEHMAHLPSSARYRQSSVLISGGGSGHGPSRLHGGGNSESLDATGGVSPRFSTMASRSVSPQHSLRQPVSPRASHGGGDGAGLGSSGRNAGRGMGTRKSVLGAVSLSGSGRFNNRLQSEEGW